MSSLIYTAQFVRMGRSSFAPKPRDVPVFAQHVAGGSGLTIVSNLMSPSPAIRLRQEYESLAEHLMAAFAIAEPELGLEGEPGSLADRLRRQATHGDLEVTVDESSVLADAVREIPLSLMLTDCYGGMPANVGLDPAFGEWVVSQVSIDFAE